MRFTIYLNMLIFANMLKLENYVRTVIEILTEDGSSWTEKASSDY